MQQLSCRSGLQWPKIKQAIQEYVQQVKNKSNSHLHQLIQSFIHHIDTNFLLNCIQICVYNQLSPLIQKPEPPLQLPGLQIMESIRETYLQMFTSGTWKDEYIFQSGLVCITKLVSQFFIEFFSDVRIDDRLQGEIYVILIYVIMGMKVGMKSFALLEKKYLKNHHKIPREIHKARESATKFSQKFSHTAYNVSQQKKTAVWNKSQNQNQLDQFADMLKSKLYVAPLPEIKKQKKSIQFYTTIPQPTHSHIRHQSTPSHIPTPTIPSPSSSSGQNPKFPFLSNQLSISLHSEIIQRNISVATHSQSIKFNYRHPYISNHSLVFVNNHCRDVETDDPIRMSRDKLKQDKWRQSSREWKSTIEAIKMQFARTQEKKGKDKVLFSQIGDNQLKFETLQMPDISDKIHDENTNELLKKQSNHHIKQRQRERGSCQDPEPTTSNFGIICAKQPNKKSNTDQISGLELGCKLTKKNIKENQIKFMKENTIRNLKMSYSMFSLPSKRNFNEQGKTVFRCL